MGMPTVSDAVHWGQILSRNLSYQQRQDFYHFIMNANADLCGELGDTMREELKEEGKTV